MILLQGNQIARLFGAEVLFENLQFEIHSHARIGLVGRNGVGKSTLLKIIAGIESPDQGFLTKSKSLTMGYLAQNTGIVSETTVWDEMLDAFQEVRQMEQRMRELEQSISTTDIETLEGKRLLKEYDQLQHQFSDKNGYGYENEIRSVLHGFQFDASFYEQEIQSLSGGQQTRLALAKMLLQQPDLLILDEPTNHLDIETLAWLENYLQNYRGALLIVSHDRYFLDEVVKEIYEISRSKMTHYKGNYSRFLDLKEEQLALDWKAYEKQQEEIHKLEDFVARNLVRASTTKRAQSRRKQLDKMTRLDRPQGDEKSANILFEIDRTSGNVVLQVQDAAIGYPDHPLLAKDIQLDVRRKDAVALVGPNGIGKSTLLKSILKEIPFVEGDIHYGTNVSMGYYDQGQKQLHPQKTILKELWDEHPTTPEVTIRRVLGSFLFSGEDVEKTVGLLSGGEKARVALAKLAMNRENFLILDEPTNHLDIDSKEVLENALIDYEGTLLFVSHDRYFINRIATKVIELSEDGSRLYLGDYDYYMEKKQEEAELAALLETPTTVEIPLSQGKKSFQQSKEEQRLLRQLQRKVTSIEEDLAAIEEEIAQLEQQMTAPEILNDHLELLRIQKTIDEKYDKQEQYLQDWETTSLALEEIETALH
ncbi:ABC-F family ATP-binding cassette domain-containing protein [Enterococcus sp. LJL98]